MAISCPHCQHAITLKGVKPGRFRPNCPKCGKAFLLTVAADGSMTPALPPAAGADPNATAPPPAETTPTAPPPPAKGKPAAGQATEATGVREPPAAKKPAPAAKPAAKPAARPAGKTSPSPDETAPLPQAKPGPETTSPEATGAWEGAAGNAGDRTEDFSAGARPGGGAGEGTEVFDPDATTPPPGGEAGHNEGDKGSAKSKAGTRGGASRKPVAKELPPDAPPSLGGYEILKQLGKGGMGTVYLARQVSLDRHVALKTMNPEWAADPRFLTRFTREAYAAAQLTHHNILQIYDIGEEKGTPFFSMEFVQGSNLGALVHRSGKLDVEAAVGYLLQAARGLKYAHEQGMVHRDIKPDNLMLNQHGIVKVADLGLVKTPQAAAQEEAAEQGTEVPEDAEVTSVGVAMGTPAYMAPEQSLNAAGVDQRADIYSLGCTLYVLLTGRPPFQGKTAMEVMSKHQTEPIVRPEKLEKRVPGEISNILMRMLAKKPEERYQDLGAVITDLEKFLGVQTAGPFSPQQEQVDALEESAKKFDAAQAAGLRKIIVPAFFGLCALLVIVGIFMMSMLGTQLALAAVGLAVFTGLFGFIACGLANRSHVFQKTRELVFGNTWFDWLMWVAAVVLFIGASYLLHMLAWWGGVLIVSAGLAATYYAIVDRQIVAQRREALEEAEKLLKTMRLKGVEEDALQQFVCKYAGQHWEEFYEALFGYDALVQARDLWSRSATGRSRPRFAPWREPVLRWIDARQKVRKEAREKRLLMKLECKELERQGLSRAEARAIAEEMAEDMVAGAAELKEQARFSDPTVVRESGQVVRISAAQLARGRRIEPGAERPRRPRQPVKKLLEMLFSPKVRFLTGAVLLGLCLLWANNNKLLSVEQAGDALTDIFSGDTQSALPGFLARVSKAEPLFGLPLFNSFNPGIAGLLLILAALMSDLHTIALCMAGALVIFFAPLVPLPEGLPIDKTLLWAGVGVGVLVLSFVLGRFLK
jgi:hypothetical protein